MNQANFIGNLTANAVQRQSNGSTFITFTIARNEKRKDGTQVAQFIECLKSGDNASLLPYLKKGTQVFVSGRVDVVKPYLSNKLGVWQSGLTLSVRELQLLSSCKREASDNNLQQAPQVQPQQSYAQPQAQAPQQTYQQPQQSAPQAPQQAQPQGYLFGIQMPTATPQPRNAQPYQQDLPF